MASQVNPNSESHGGALAVTDEYNCQTPFEQYAFPGGYEQETVSRTESVSSAPVGTCGTGHSTPSKSLCGKSEVFVSQRSEPDTYFRSTTAGSPNVASSMASSTLNPACAEFVPSSTVPLPLTVDNVSTLDNGNAAGPSPATPVPSAPGRYIPNVKLNAHVNTPSDSSPKPVYTSAFNLSGPLVLGFPPRYDPKTNTHFTVYKKSPEMHSNGWQHPNGGDGPVFGSGGSSGQQHTFLVRPVMNATSSMMGSSPGPSAARQELEQVFNDHRGPMPPSKQLANGAPRMANATLYNAVDNGIFQKQPLQHFHTAKDMGYNVQPEDLEKQQRIMAVLQKTAAQAEDEIKKTQRRRTTPVNIQPKNQYEMTPTRAGGQRTGGVLSQIESPTPTRDFSQQLQQAPPRYMLPTSSAEKNVNARYDQQNGNARANEHRRNESSVACGPMNNTATKASMEAPSMALTILADADADDADKGPSRELMVLVGGPSGLPTSIEALSIDNFPFVEIGAHGWVNRNHGVIKLKIIGFTTTRAEIIALFGRNSRVLNDRDEPVHIIQEEAMYKKTYAYVEFQSVQDASAALAKWRQRGPRRLGNRPAELELSSMSNLMGDLYYRAKGIDWYGMDPVIKPDDANEPWNAFKGFFQPEHLTAILKQIETPNRPGVTKESPQRPYEYMISFVRKFPWHKTDLITVVQRQQLFETCVKMLRHLRKAIRQKQHEVLLNEQLYKRLSTTCMLCNGFTVIMKEGIARIAGLSSEQQRKFNQPRCPEKWIHLWSMVPKPGAPLDLVEWYLTLVREETTRAVQQSAPNVQAMIRRTAGTHAEFLTGYFYREVNLSPGPAFDNMTLAELATREFDAMTRVIRCALASQ